MGQPAAPFRAATLLELHSNRCERALCFVRQMKRGPKLMSQRERVLLCRRFSGWAVLAAKELADFHASGLQDVAHKSRHLL